MIYVVPFAATHFVPMTVQKEQEWLMQVATVESLKALENDCAITVMRDGVPVACGGALPYEPHRAMMWSFMSEAADWRVFPYIHRAARELIESLPFKRLEASVVVGFERGHRWMKLLGFEVETPLQRAFLPDGTDCVGYVRIR